MKKLLVVSLMLICLMSTVALAQNVNVDWQRSTNFTQYKTYAWGVSPHPISDGLWNDRIVGMINAALQSKGLTMVDANSTPDLIVVYNAGIKQNVSLQGYRTGVFMASGSISQVVENDATLVVDLADPKQMMTIWRGMAEQTLSDKSDKNIAKVQKMISKMFQKFPPK
jgi:hypothetical protein